MLNSLAYRFLELVGVSPRSDLKTYERLRRLKEPKHGADQRLVRLRWGMCEYSKLANLVSQYKCIFVNREYSFNSSANVPVIVDCGGNIGVSAIWFKLNYPGCKLTVYEADPDLAAIARRNLDRAGYADANVQNNAVWSEERDLVFSARGDDTGRIDPLGNVRVKAIDLSLELPEQVDLLKVDIEGAEFSVFERLIETGTINQVKNLVAELHPSKPTKVRMLRIIQSFADIGFEFAFFGDLARWLGPEEDTAPFHFVGRNRMFLQMYAWRS